MKTREDRAVYRDMKRFARDEARLGQRLERQYLPRKSYEGFSRQAIGCTGLERRIAAMHRSQLAGFIIDCQLTEPAQAARFWSTALGMQATAFPGPEGVRYMKLTDSSRELHIEVQNVDHPSRVHLDIETDDIEAEVRRLESLGARRVTQVHTWWVMEAPTGHRFCVVRAASPSFEKTAHQWT